MKTLRLRMARKRLMVARELEESACSAWAAVPEESREGSAQDKKHYRMVRTLRAIELRKGKTA